jgi:translocation and assembly module TamB
VLDFEGWNATNLTGEYAYHYPDRRLSFRKIKANLLDGAVTGNTIVERFPGASRVTVDLDYTGANAAALARAYPWDPKYRIFSRLTGNLNGWFEGKLVRYDFSGRADLAAYEPVNAAGLVPLPLDGSASYRLRPGEASIFNAAGRFYSTSVVANGLVTAKASDLKLSMTSSNLKDLAFLYSDANGSGSFDGVLTGPISQPTLTGNFTVENYAYRQWTIQHAHGGATLDTAAQNVEFRNTQIIQNRSEVIVNGNIALSGSPANLQVQATRVFGKDLRVFVNRNIDGTFSGNLRITSLSPMRLEGDVQADDSSLENRVIGDMRGHIRYFEPVIEVDQLSIKRDQATLTGSLVLNQATDALKFNAHLNNFDLASFGGLGIPDSVKGVVRQAELRGDGTVQRPNVSGNAIFQELSVFSETFSQARAELSSAGSKLNVTLSTGNNISLTGQIDTATTGYPFTAHATFDRYPLERIAGLSEGTVVATGSATFSGSFNDRTQFHGQGQIQSAEAIIQKQSVRTTKPFSFDFNSDRLTVTGVTLTGQATQVSMAGTVGLNARAPLNLDVSGRIDVALLSAAYPEWSSSGSVNVEGRVGGTVQNPDLRGVAHLAKATIGRRGFFTSLSNLSGDVFFDQDRVTLNNIEGTMGGGIVRAQGTAVLRRQAIQDMNVRIEGDNVRVRYPEGLRTVVDASLVLRGSSTSPLLEGDVQIQTLAYRTDFGEFLALLAQRDVTPTASPLGRLRLAVHVEGSRNITIQNQLADVEARVDVDLNGTLDNPSITGHIEASGGTLLFQGNRYQVTRGNIDLVDPQRIEPVLDVQAESEVRDYRVILSISGRGDRLRLDMRSEPPLPELEIVSLIAGGRTREEYANQTDSNRPDGPQTPTSEQLFQSGAASILLDLLQERVGNRLGLFGLDRFRLDPFLVGEANDPSARITFSEQVTKDLTVTYSQALSSDRQQIITIEYFLDRNTSILATRDDFGNLGLDVRFRKRF